MESIQGERKLTRRQKWAVGLGAAGVAGLYFTYRVYRSDSLAALLEMRRRLSKSMEGYSKSLLLASECTTEIMEELREFLSSDADDVPQSLKQVAKLAKSPEISEAASKLAAAVVQGALSDGGNSSSSTAGDREAASSGDFLDRILTALSTERGANLVSLAISMGCRSSIQAIYEFGSRGEQEGSQQQSFWQQILEFGATPRGGILYNSCIGTFVREGMQVYMGSLEGTNAWEDFLGSLCKPERQVSVDRMTRVFVNELVVSLLKRSRQSYKGEARSSKGSASGRQGILSSARNLSALALASEGRLNESCCAAPAMTKDASARRASAEDVVLPEDIAAPGLSTYVAIAQQMMQPEVRGLLTVVVGTAAFEGVRSLVFATREMLTGTPALPSTLSAQPASARQLQQLTSRALGTLLLFVFMPVIIFLAGRRAALS